MKNVLSEGPGLITATPLTGSSIGRVERDILCDLSLPAVPVREQAFLVVVELLGCLGRELEVRSQDDGVDRAGLLAEAAVDAFIMSMSKRVARRVPSLRRGPASMVMACAGQIASHSLQAMQRSSPLG